MTGQLAIDVDLQGSAQVIPGYATTQVWVSRPSSAQSPEGRESQTLIRQQVTLSPTADRHEMVAQVQKAVDAGAPNVVKLFPGLHGDGFPLATWTLNPLTALCERDGYALSVDYGGKTLAPLVELDEFARQAPEVPILLLGEHLEPRLGFWRLLDRCPNVLLEITPRIDPGAVRDAVDTFGAHRFAFGSRGNAIPVELLAVLPGEARDTILRVSAERLDDRTWRDDYL